MVQKLEAGICLTGTEVKSIKTGQAAITGSFARVEDGALVLYHMNIPPYECGNIFNHVQDRPRRLLLHRVEILRLQQQSEQKGHTIVPLSVYTRRGYVKVEIGVCKGKRLGDKRETLKRKTADREAERAMAAHRRR